jgi:large subunit ribosomal protein L9
VTPSEIADALAERGIQVDRRRVELAEPIKRLGEHTIHVRFHKDVVAEVTVEVQPVAVPPA